MNVLIIGQMAKLAKCIDFFADNIYIVVDSTCKNFRSYKEVNDFNILESSIGLSVKSIPIRINEIRNWVCLYDIDVVYTNEKMSMIAAKLAFLGHKNRPLLISTAHDSYAWKRWNANLMARVVDWATDGFVALASFVYRCMEKNGTKREKLLLQPNTIEYETFMQKSEFLINPNNVRLVYVAVVYPGKSQKTVVEVIHELESLGITASIDFYGEVLDEVYKNEINDVINNYGLVDRVHFKGRIDNSELKCLFPHYDIYICPSRMEMSPFNILEAMASALPIVANRVGGIPDLIEDGVDGILIKDGVVSAYVNAIMKLVKDCVYACSLGTNAYTRVSQKQSYIQASYKLHKFFLSLKK